MAPGSKDARHVPEESLEIRSSELQVADEVCVDDVPRTSPLVSQNVEHLSSADDRASRARFPGELDRDGRGIERPDTEPEIREEAHVPTSSGTELEHAGPAWHPGETAGSQTSGGAAHPPEERRFAAVDPVPERFGSGCHVSPASRSPEDTWPCP